MTWDSARLADLGTVVTGGTPSTTALEFYGGNVPFVTPADLDRVGPLLEAARSLTKVGAKQVRTVPAGAVMVSCIGTLGKVGIAGVEVATNQQINTIVFNASRVNPRYGYHACRTLRRKLESIAPATTLPIVSKSKFEQITIPVPPLSEQHRIAEILDKADALRAKRRDALAQLDTLTQSIFLDMFGDPASNPRNWREHILGETLDTSPNFGTMIPAAPTGGDWLCLRVANIQNWRLDLSDRKFVDLPAKDLERHTVRKGDLLMARAIATEEQLGKSIVVQPHEEGWAFDSHLMRLRFNLTRAQPEFVRHALKTPGGRSLFLRSTRQSAVQFNINTKEISALRLPLPAIDLQNRFAELVSASERGFTLQRTAVQELDALFASLQHQAFRGEL